MKTVEDLNRLIRDEITAIEALRSEDDEGQGWCELHQESVCFIDKCSDRISKV